MLSNSLQSLASHFDGWAANGGVALDGRVCTILGDQLRAVAAEAAAVEAQLVPASARGHHPGVVNLDVAREARALRRSGGDWGAT